MIVQNNSTYHQPKFLILIKNFIQKNGVVIISIYYIHNLIMLQNSIVVQGVHLVIQDFAASNFLRRNNRKPKFPTATHCSLELSISVAVFKAFCNVYRDENFQVFY